MSPPAESTPDRRRLARVAVVGVLLLFALSAWFPSPPRSQGNRVFVLGVDGLSGEVLRNLVGNQDLLPNLASLLNGKTSADLHTLETPVSAALWTSITTGQLPVHHGITTWELDGSLISSADVRVPRVWDVLGFHGRTSAVIGVPATWPASEMNGLLASDRFVMEASNPATSHPSLSTVFPSSRAAAALGTFTSGMEKIVDFLEPLPPSPSPLFRAQVADQGTFRVALQAWTTGGYDLVWAHLYGLDACQHLYWPFQDSRYEERLRLLPDQWKVDSTAEGRPGEEVRILLPWRGQRLTPPLLEKARGMIPACHASLDEMVGRILPTLTDADLLMVVGDHGFATRYRGAVPEGVHRPLGLWLMGGAQVKSETRLESATLLDIAPTLLAWLGLPQDLTMPGDARTDAFHRILSLPRYLPHPITGPPTQRGEGPDPGAPLLDLLIAVGDLK